MRAAPTPTRSSTPSRRCCGAPGGAAGRYAALRPGPGGGSPSPAEAHRRAVVIAAVALVEGPTDQREPTEGLA